MKEPNPGDSYDCGALKEKPYLAVDIEIERKFISKKVARSLLLMDERTKRLAILTRPNATNFRMTNVQKGVIESIIDGSYEPVLPEQETTCPAYSEADFLNEVYSGAEYYATLKGLLLRKKNVILQGSPGVGKTFSAQRLAFSMMGEKDTSRVEIVQFHQSYSYEDFIMGYRPDGSGFRLAERPFYRFCKIAESDDERSYFFIIDEINRGNLSKIFGELLMLIEGDKRGERNALRLLYKDEQFSVPANLHLIGMMNTADRSLAMIDYALRRRFAFFDLGPAFQSDGFKARQAWIRNPKFDALIAMVESLNREIGEDASLGMGFRIGHSYFCASERDVIDDVWLSSVIEYELLPLLKEYWFDEPSKVERWTNKLQSVLDG
ncbi:MAG: AAA family ATPase [Zoogloeaceae bacterium]|jgi:MoxR-like ATPase|nr:AAA family ATPase [Zoogloeaceae bacterium]